MHGMEFVLDALPDPFEQGVGEQAFRFSLGAPGATSAPDGALLTTVELHWPRTGETKQQTCVLAESAHAGNVDRVTAYVRAWASALPVFAPAVLAGLDDPEPTCLMPSELTFPQLLADASLQSESDFAAVFARPERLVATVLAARAAEDGDDFIGSLLATVNAEDAAADEDPAAAVARWGAAVAERGALLHLGSVAFPTGRIVAADPYQARNVSPFGRTVPPGRYELELGQVDMDPFGRRVAFARLSIRPQAEVAGWEVARSGGAGGCWGEGTYAVDSGLGSFMDEQSRAEFEATMDRHEAQHPDGNYHRDVLGPDMKRNATTPDRPGTWAIHTPPGTDAQVAVFRSGLGDGYYRSYWGLGADDGPVALVTDFGLVD